MAMLTTLAEQLARHGLALRGGFAVTASDGTPTAAGGRPACTLVLVGNVGGAMWSHFSAWPGESGPDPLDRWTKAIVDPIAAAAGARAVYPSDRPWQPFQRWAMKAEGLRPSPLGLLMHPVYGLWHAYRAALLFDVGIPFPLPRAEIHACDQCVDRPCLTSCPVSAYGAGGFDAAACAGHAGGAAGSACRERGCLDRNACPVGTDWRYPPEQQAFHMAAFLRPRG